LSTQNSYSSASLNGSWINTAGFANVGNSPYYPGNTPSLNLPAVQRGFFNDYDYAMIDLLGAVTELNGTFNYAKDGTLLPQGTPILRDFSVNNYGFFAQDQWHVTPNLVLTTGLRWSYQQPPNEKNGNQVYPCVASSSGSCSSQDLQGWFENTGALAQQGLPASNAGQVAFELGGASNNGPAMWKSEWHDLAPRIGVAWSPNFGTGWLAKVFGGPGQFSIRGGYDLLFEHFGNAIVNTFSSNGAIGLTSQVGSAEGITIGQSPRFTCTTCLPTMPGKYAVSPPPGGFPQVPAATFGNIAWGLDSSLRTPFVHELDFSLTRQIGNNQSLSLSYVGTFGRYLPMQEDLAQPSDLVDPGSRQDYFSAAQQLDKYAMAGTPTANVPNIPFWQHFFPGWNGLTVNDLTNANLGACADNPSGPLSATQAMYQWYSCNVGDDTTALFSVDIPGTGLPAPSTGFYSMVHAQYGSLYAWNNVGTSNYNALQATYKTHFGNNLQATINYTWSHALDEASNAERSSTFSGTGAIVNAWDPLALYANADFNMAQQFNANWVWQLPFGRNQAFAGNDGNLLDALIGGWRLSGDFLTTSGLPGNVSDGQQWSTDWQLSGAAVMTGPIPGMQTTYATQGKQGRGPNLFANPSAAFGAFTANLPGQSGTRNTII
ncbi:MAG: TonB-dependent receptor domain-containing protein, partial [Terriglobales bacterium]